MVQIIGSEDELKVWEIYASMKDHEGNPYPEQKFRVIRKSNAREWLECYLANGGNQALADNVLSYFYLYYEIQTD